MPRATTMIYCHLYDDELKRYMKAREKTKMSMNKFVRTAVLAYIDTLESGKRK